MMAKVIVCSMCNDKYVLYTRIMIAIEYHNCKKKFRCWLFSLLNFTFFQC